MATMASEAPTAAKTLDQELYDKVKELVEFALGLAAVVAGLGAALYYTWNWGLASAPADFTVSIPTYWVAVTVVLGLYAAYSVWASARDNKASDVFSFKDGLDIIGAVDALGKPGVVLGLAAIVQLID
ncbi:hypothetical protein HY379_02280 [Candidatus Saccharibacteria bacterium]|nr:hypothetical protein [Candidatus Saccharibacteria bacterium]